MLQIQSETSPLKLKKIIYLTFIIFIFSAILTAVISYKFTITAETSGSFEYTVTDGKATITKYTSPKDTEIIIPDKLGIYPVVAITASAFADCLVENLEIPDTITKLPTDAFFYCKNIKTVKIPVSVTSIQSDSFDTNIKFTVIGIQGSYAETYANKYKLTFYNGVASSNLTLEVGTIEILPETADVTAGFITAEVPLYLSGSGNVNAIQTSIILGDGTQYETVSLNGVVPNTVVLKNSQIISKSIPDTGYPADIEKSLFSTQTDVPAYMVIMAFDDIALSATPVEIATLQVKILLTAESLYDLEFGVSIARDVTYVTVDSAMSYLSVENGVKNGVVTLKGVLSVFNGKYGDVDLDRYVTINDVVWVLRYVAQSKTFTLEQRYAADVFIEQKDITVNVVDVVAIINYILQMKDYTDLPINKLTTTT
jgi:hypothetical protein